MKLKCDPINKIIIVKKKWKICHIESTLILSIAIRIKVNGDTQIVAKKAMDKIFAYSPATNHSLPNIYPKIISPYKNIGIQKKKLIIARIIEKTTKSLKIVSEEFLYESDIFWNRTLPIDCDKRATGAYPIL